MAKYKPVEIKDCVQLTVKNTDRLSLKVASRRCRREKCLSGAVRLVIYVMWERPPEMFMVGCVPRGWPFVSAAFHSSVILHTNLIPPSRLNSSCVYSLPRTLAPACCLSCFRPPLSPAHPASLVASVATPPSPSPPLR